MLVSHILLLCPLPAPSALVAGSVNKHAGPLGAGWFGSFAEGESTTDDDADGRAHYNMNPSAAVWDGWEYHPDDGQAGAWFHESESGAQKQAWQSHYPTNMKGLADRDVQVGKWRVTGGGHWVQDYTPQEASPEKGPRDAAWFDASVNQYDGFGRMKSPHPQSGKRLVLWQERAVNTTLTCASAGCTASVPLQAFDGSTEMGHNCKLNLGLHPTDFDDQYSGERLDFIQLNGRSVNADCFPMVTGCNATTQAPLFPCLQQLPLDGVINETGTLLISVKISDMVDECPFEGNLLSAVPVVTCMVAPKRLLVSGADGPYLGNALSYTPADPNPSAVAGSVGTPAATLPDVPPMPSSVNVSVPIRCQEHGCVALKSVNLTSLGLNFSSCALTLSVFQTDYDQSDGTIEQVEYISLNSVKLATNTTPGKNPCRAEWAGQPLPHTQYEYIAISNQDITSEALKGLLAFEAKITDHVDECAYNGYLLNALARISCQLAKDTSITGSSLLQEAPLLRSPTDRNASRPRFLAHSGLHIA